MAIGGQLIVGGMLKNIAITITFGATHRQDLRKKIFERFVAKKPIQNSLLYVHSKRKTLTDVHGGI